MRPSLAAPTITWASYPVSPAETVVLTGSHFPTSAGSVSWAPDGTGQHFHGDPVSKLGFALNTCLVFRGNVLRSNSGIRVERQAEDVLVEGTVQNNTDTPEPIVTDDCVRVLVTKVKGSPSLKHDDDRHVYDATAIAQARR